MIPSRHPILLDILYQSAALPLGLAVRHPEGDNVLLRAQLYKARQKTLDPTLAKLQIRLIQDEVWVCHEPEVQ